MFNFVFPSLQHSITSGIVMWSRKMGLILRDERFHSVELNGKWSRKHKTRFKCREHTLKTVLRHFEGCCDLFLCLLLFKRLQKHWKHLGQEVHRLHFCETNPGQIGFFFLSVDPFLVAAIFPGCFLKKQRKSGRSATVLTRGTRNSGRRGRRQSVPSALYTGGLMWWS